MRGGGEGAEMDKRGEEKKNQIEKKVLSEHWTKDLGIMCLLINN